MSMGDSAKRGPIWLDDDSGELELDLRHDSGHWRGVVPGALESGPNAQTLDPEARNLDPAMHEHLRRAARAPTEVVPARAVSPISATAAIRELTGQPPIAEGRRRRPSETLPPLRAAESRSTMRAWDPREGRPLMASEEQWRVVAARAERRSKLITLGTAVAIIVLMALLLFLR
jgi:hypothetical protein